MDLHLKFNKLLRGVIGDSFLNIIASLLLTVTTQILVYPFLAKVYNGNDYGVILTVMGLINSIGVSVGSSLNNSRLLLQSYYKKNKVIGDFNIIFVVTSIIGIIIFLFMGSSLFYLSNYELIISGCVVFLIAYRSYYSVDFRIYINYRKTLMSNLFGAIGYLLGFLVFKLTNNWIDIFLIGELTSCIYITKNTTLFKEKLILTRLFSTSLKKYNYILLASVLSNVMLYMDRFLIFPLLGSHLVSVYTVASFLGKSAGILLNPISGVLLTYYAKEDNLSVKSFLKRLIIFISMGLIIFTGIMITGEYLIELLYPTLSLQALPYFYIANLAAIVLIIGNVIQPTLLRYSHSRWQLITQILYLIIYLCATYYGMNYFGLMGFCYAILFANSFRLVFMTNIVILSLNKKHYSGA